jgi:hypothetical protein
MRKELNKLRAVSYRNRIDTHHCSHRELKRKSKIYGNAIVSAKKAHWEEYLKNMIGDDIWTANKYIKNPVGDGGVSRIPTIRTRNAEWEETATNDNEEKAIIFTEAFFHPPPIGIALNAEQEDYPDPLPDPPPPTKQQIEKMIWRLPSYKASGPDGIPNIVLQKCFDLIADHLLHIYQTILKLGQFFDPWREFTTIILKKPDKPNYEVPKAYRPIALISTLEKVLTTIVAENISWLVEQHQLLPKMHFRGRPGRTTTDTIHYLVHKIKQAWSNE